MDQATFRRASAAAQGVLRVSQPNLMVDGWFGTYSMNAYKSAKSEIRVDVDVVLRALGTDVDSLQNFAKSLKSEAANMAAESSEVWISQVEAYALVDRAASQLGVGEFAESLKSFLDIEAKRVVRDGKVFYNVLSRSGSFRGLFQMGSPAWTDSIANARAKGIDIPSYEDGWNVARWNVLAGVAYAAGHIRRMKADRVPITVGTLYTAHNQGYAGAKSYFRTGNLPYPKQSQAALALMATGRKDVGNTAFV